jgi:hypothetical protein
LPFISQSIEPFELFLTAPAPPAAQPELASWRRLANGSFEFQFDALAGQTNVIDASTDLINWVPIATNFLDCGVLNVLDPGGFSAPVFTACASPSVPKRHRKIIIPRPPLGVFCECMDNEIQPPNPEPPGSQSPNPEPQASQPPPGSPPPNPQPPPLRQDRTLDATCHFLSFAAVIGIPFGNILGPLVLWAIKKDEMPRLTSTAKNRSISKSR